METYTSAALADVTCPDKATFSKVGNDQAKNGNSGKGKDENKTN